MALFSAIGAGIKLAGAGIKSIINRAREKRAAKKAARAAQKQSEAGALLSKILIPQQQAVSTGVVSDKLEPRPAAMAESKKVSPFWVGSALGALILLLILKRK